MTGNHIPIVDDEPNVIAAIRRVLIDEPYGVYGVMSAHEGLEIVQQNPVKVVVSDERMPGMSGSEFLAAIRRDHPHIIRIMLTGYAGIDAAMRAIIAMAHSLNMKVPAEEFEVFHRSRTGGGE
ncbi:MAG: response regulator [Alphaproteobacteria bacterium]|uniref:Response regulator n=1 Tax=Candidatus Nitrobium versatile TaxID=2884831 RepID=A0A953J6J6_9BACT|nr:response regulator [Candidatus Nitrobium versatile]